jgi:hypothetical protein
LNKRKSFSIYFTLLPKWTRTLLTGKSFNPSPAKIHERHLLHHKNKLYLKKSFK